MGWVGFFFGKEEVKYCCERQVLLVEESRRQDVTRTRKLETTVQDQSICGWCEFFGGCVVVVVRCGRWAREGKEDPFSFFSLFLSCPLWGASDKYQRICRILVCPVLSMDSFRWNLVESEPRVKEGHVTTEMYLMG